MALSFFAGGGEMGARMRALDWTRTPLGPADRWPQSLKTIVRVMLDSRYAMWMLWGPELTFFCNDAYLPTVGVKGDWVLGASSDKVWEEIWSDIGPRIARVLEFGQATWDEGLLLFLERSGFSEETYHTFSYSPVYNDEDRIAGMLCVVTEVTERVIGERRLRVLRDLATCTMGVEGVATSCQRLCQVLGQYPLDTPFAALYLVDPAAPLPRCVAHTAGVDFHLLQAGLTLGRPADAMQELMRSQTVQELDGLHDLGIAIPAGPWPDLVQRALLLPIMRTGTDGLVGALIVGLSPRRPPDAAYRSFVELVSRQIATAIADAEAFEAQRRRAEALAEIDRAKTIFFSNTSHEFRTPLTLMLGPLEQVLDDTRLPPDVRDRLDMVRRNSQRLLKLVNSLLDFARIEAGRMQTSFLPTDLGPLTSDIASTFRSAIERAGLQFIVECADLEEPLYVDREMWEKIVLNLLSNAFKFTLAGEISLRVRREGRHALLTVTDTGAGIPEKEMEHLFERFHRVEGTPARTQEGSGIGLALVQELLKLHGASIEAASTVGRGTTFSVRVPFGSAHLPPERLTAGAPAQGAASRAQPFVEEALRWLPDGPSRAAKDLAVLGSSVGSVPDPRFAKTFGARVVLADDNTDMRAYVCDLLSPLYAVEAVADGVQALAAARRQRPDLIIADVMMPHLDGFGLLAAVRQDEALRSVPLVLLSARAGEDARIEGLDAGADDYLTKPFAARELVARVGALLELQFMRRETDQALQRRSVQFQTLLNDAPLGVYLVDADLKLREVNPTAKRFFGNLPDLIGRDFAEIAHRLWHPELATEMVRMFCQTLTDGEPQAVREQLDPRTGVIYEWQISRIALLDGRPGVVCYFRDVSVHVLARRALQDADRQKDEFLAMLAHELRSPLAPMQSATTLLAALNLREPHAQFSVGVIQRQVMQLTRLVDDLLDVSRITQGRIELKCEPVELGAVIAQAVEMADSLFRDKQHEVTIMPSPEPIYLFGDNARLIQCIGNILSNAAKYTDPCGHIEIRSVAEGKTAVITIADNGVGISADLLPRIFDLFIQSDRTLDRSQGGLGIGLSVVKQLVDMHGGRVTARSGGIGKGAQFEIRLPIVVPQTRTEAAQSPISVGPQRILVVDDNVDAADTLALLLEIEGHDTKAVYTASETLRLAPSFKPSVVLLDLGLPGMNGYEVATAIRATPALSGVRLVALTGYGKPEDLQRTQAAGFDAHLVKPVELEDLTRALVHIDGAGPA